MSAFAFEGFLSTPGMLAIFGEEALLQHMLDFEAALARAQAAEGLVPSAAADVIARACRIDGLDIAALVADSRPAGSIAIPLVRQLTAKVAALDAEAARFVHWGSTSQDVIDTAMVLATREALRLIEDDRAALVENLLALYERHGTAPVLARTLMQPAQVVSFGFKLAAWIAPLVRAKTRLDAAASNALQLQLGGAVGTLSVMADRGAAVVRRVAEDLKLRVPVAAWHTQRDEWLTLGTQVAIFVGSLGKMARDWSLMAQGEVGELNEPSGHGRGGSSAMPHKRNPVASMVALAAADRVPHRIGALLAVMVQEHERGLGNWQAELAEWSGLFASAHGAVEALARASAGLDVHEDKMLANIDRLDGLVHAEALSMALARTLGKGRAHHLVEEWSRAVVREQRSLQDVAAGALPSGSIAPSELVALFDTERAAEPARRLAAHQIGALHRELTT